VCHSRQKRIASVTSSLLLPLLALGDELGDVDLGDGARELPGCSELAHKGGVGVGLGTPEPVIEMRDMKSYVKFLAEDVEDVEDVEKAEGVGATGDGDDNGVAGLKKIVSVNRVSDSG
jgi:hypothetical protein